MKTIATCCQKCRHATEDGKCKKYYLTCEAWRSWFRKEWEQIRKAAAIIKKNSEGDGSE